MTSEELLRGIGGLNPRYVAEAEAYRAPAVRPWLKWAALAACLAVAVTAAWNLLPRPGQAESDSAMEETVQDSVTEHAESDNPMGEADMNGSTDSAGEGKPAAERPGILTGETIGGLRLGMSEQEVEAVLGTGYTVSNSGVVEVTEDYRCINWFYPGVIVGLVDTGGGWFLNEIWLLSDSPLTLSTGIGIGSTEAEVAAAYPEAEAVGETDGGGPESLQIGTFENGLWIGLENGRVDGIFLGCLAPYPQEALMETPVEPPFAALSADSIRVQDADGSAVELVARAAKKVSTVLTISEPEPADRPGEAPKWWLDFGNGTYLAVYGHDDLATVYTGDRLDVTLETMEEQGTGAYLDLDKTLAGALANPTETWE